MFLFSISFGSLPFGFLVLVLGLVGLGLRLRHLPHLRGLRWDPVAVRVGRFAFDVVLIILNVLILMPFNHKPAGLIDKRLLLACKAQVLQFEQWQESQSDGQDRPIVTRDFISRLKEKKIKVTLRVPNSRCKGNGAKSASAKCGVGGVVSLEDLVSIAAKHEVHFVVVGISKSSDKQYRQDLSVFDAPFFQRTWLRHDTALAVMR